MNQYQIARSLSDLAELMGKKEPLALNCEKIPCTYQKGRPYHLAFSYCLSIADYKDLVGLLFGGEVIFIGNDLAVYQFIPMCDPVVVESMYSGLISVLFKGKAYELTAQSVSMVDEYSRG